MEPLTASQKAWHILRNGGPAALATRLWLLLDHRLRRAARARTRRDVDERYERRLRELPGVDGLVETPVLGFRLLLRRDDPGLSRELIGQGIRERQAVELLTALLHDRRRILEIGANIGFYVMIEATHAPDAVIHAIEPHPDNVTLLRRNVALNAAAGRVQVHEMAVSGREGLATLHVTPRSNWHHLDAYAGDDNLAAGDQREVRTTTVDAFCRAHGVRPDLIRMDVEGHEAAVIDGARETLGQADDCLLFIELHTELLRTLGRPPEALLAELRALGFACTAVCGNEARPPLRDPAWPTLLQTLDVIVAAHGSHFFFRKSSA